MVPVKIRMVGALGPGQNQMFTEDPGLGLKFGKSRNLRITLPVLKFPKTQLLNLISFQKILPSPTAFINQYYNILLRLYIYISYHYIFYPSARRAEGYCRHGSGGRPGGRAGGCQTCGTHISVTAWRIFSIRSSMELSRPVVVHCHGNLPICPIWACPWAKNLSNLPQIGSRLCGTHISETAGWIYPI